MAKSRELAFIKNLEKERLIGLYQQISDLTKPKCAECLNPHSCCSLEFCETAEKFAFRNGIVLKRLEGTKLPFLREDGTCIVPPHLRPICALHACSIQHEGHDPDESWNYQYYGLREEIEDLEWG